MSSDSDSDICDFSSDISKQMSKGMNKFWSKYKNKVANLKHDDGNSKSSPETINASNTNVNKLASCDKEIITEDEDGTSCGVLENTTLSNSSAVANSTENSEVNNVSNTDIHGRIVNKLDQLSETLKTILEDNGRGKKTRKNGPKRKRKAVSTRRSARLNANQSEVIPIEQNVVISSDEEDVKMKNSKVLKTEEINPPVTVNILWKSIENKLFKVRKFQHLTCISEYYINKLKIHPKLLLFTVNDKRVNLDDHSYVSLRLNEENCIEGGTLPESYLNNENLHPIFEEKNLLEFKIQYRASKNQQFSVKCKSTDTMEIIMWQIVKEIKQPVENIKLYFDGQLVKHCDTIEALDLEEGDCFDLNLLQ